MKGPLSVIECFDQKKAKKILRMCLINNWSTCNQFTERKVNIPRIQRLRKSAFYLSAEIQYLEMLMVCPTAVCIVLGVDSAAEALLPTPQTAFFNLDKTTAMCEAELPRFEASLAATPSKEHARACRQHPLACNRPGLSPASSNSSSNRNWSSCEYLLLPRNSLL